MARPAPVSDPGLVSAGHRFFWGPFDPFDATILEADITALAGAATLPLTLEHWTDSNTHEILGLQDVDLPDDKLEVADMTTQQSRGPWGAMGFVGGVPATNAPICFSKTQVPGYRGISSITLKFLYGTHVYIALSQLKPVDANIELTPVAGTTINLSGLAPRGRKTFAVLTPDGLLLMFKALVTEVKTRGPIAQPIGIDFAIDQEGPIIKTPGYVPSF